MMLLTALWFVAHFYTFLQTQLFDLERDSLSNCKIVGISLITTFLFSSLTSRTLGLTKINLVKVCNILGFQKGFLLWQNMWQNTALHL